jgi:nitric oxide reductase NorQ protein/cobaltochelatase CobS
MSDFDQAVIASVATELLKRSSNPPSKSAVIDRLGDLLDGASEDELADCLSVLCVELAGEGDDSTRLRLRGVDGVPAASGGPSGGASTADAQHGVTGADPPVTEVGAPTDRTVGQLTVLSDVGHEKVPEIAEEAYHERSVVDDKTDVQVVTKALEEGMNVVLKGPPGVGKSYLAKYICAQTNRPLYRVTLSETTYREDLLGHLQLVSSPGGDSVTSWVDGPLTRAAREGGILLLDEINAADANTAAALNSVMEQEATRSLTIPQTGEVVTPHEEFGVIATSNPGYQGTYEQNAAFEGRFRHVELDYVPAEVEVEIILERTGVDRRKREEIEQLVTFAHRLRDAYAEGELTTPITTRELVRIVTFMRRGFMDLETATRSELLARVDDHDTSLVATLLEKGF